MAEHATIIRIARFQPAAGKRDELTRQLKEGAAQIRDMEGCFGAQICRSSDSSDAVVAISRWASQAALDKFLQASAAQRAGLGELLTGTPATETLSSV
ncbi:MAG: antibiotic biosynthesis monooxygenase [Chloroflexi bacterium]|nr:antibiotic biosynthesis monooxygenase [Chloroflexota bacterium]